MYNNNNINYTQGVAMPRKKLDNRIRVVLENGVAKGHRSMVVVVGEKAKDQVIGGGREGRRGGREEGEGGGKGGEGGGGGREEGREGKGEREEGEGGRMGGKRGEGREGKEEGRKSLMIRVCIF